MEIFNGDFDNFIKISDDKICHVRPKGRDSSDLMLTASGSAEKKKCYWLNAAYIRNIIAQDDGIKDHRFLEKEKSGLFFSDVIPEATIEKGYLPIYDLQAVATTFGEQPIPSVKGWKPMKGRRCGPGMFIAQVVGKSMEPTIPDGSFCLFRFERGGSRGGLIVLVESRLVTDSETHQSFTIKRYHSEKENLSDEQWRHKKIILSPDNKDFKDIVLENVSGEDFRVVAEFIEVLR